MNQIFPIMLAAALVEKVTAENADKTNWPQFCSTKVLIPSHLWENSSSKIRDGPQG